MRPRFHGYQKELIIELAEINKISPHSIIVAMSLMLKQTHDGIIPQEYLDELYKHQPQKDERS